MNAHLSRSALLTAIRLETESRKTEMHRTREPARSRQLELLLQVDGCASRVRIAPMLDPETLEFIDAARSCRQIELSVRLIKSALDHMGDRACAAEAVRAQAWNDAEAAVIRAVEKYAQDGLRVVRTERTRHGLILTASVATWRRFLEEQRLLVGSREIEFRQYTKPWSYGLPGFPE